MKHLINAAFIVLLAISSTVTIAAEATNNLGKETINFILRSNEVNRIDFTIGFINDYENTYLKYKDGIIIDGQVCTLSNDSSKIFDICKPIETFTDNLVSFALSLSKEQLDILSTQDNVIAKIIMLYFSAIEYFDKNSKDAKICSKDYNAYCLEKAYVYMNGNK